MIPQNQPGPRPGQHWMTPGQGPNFAYQPRQPANQFMPSNTPMGQPTASSGPPVVQNIPLFSAQNGNVTPPSSQNPPLNNPSPYGAAIKQTHMDQVRFMHVV